MRLIYFLCTAILWCLQSSSMYAAEHDNVATHFKIENERIILVQNAGCNECKRRWQNCRINCNSPPGFNPLTYRQCLIVCDTAGQACVQRFC
jgi:hypothetical protein